MNGLEDVNHEGREEHEVHQISDLASELRTLGLFVHQRDSFLNVATSEEERGGITLWSNSTLVSFEPDGWSLWDGQIHLSTVSTTNDVVTLIRERYEL